MRSKIFTSCLALILGVGLMQFSITDSFAAPNGTPGKPGGDTKVPPGIKKQYSSDRGIRSPKWRDFCNNNAVACGGTIITADGTAETDQGDVICSTALEEEALRECLGQPPIVKKAVRVKKVKVELNSAQ